MAKTLVIYYSREGENYVNGSIRNLARGNTELVAGYVRDAVGADLFRIQTVKEYSKDYMDCTREAQAELRADARPELAQILSSVDAYDNIVVAGPCWWGTYPMAVFTQLDALDFTGKTVFAVMTHEGSGQAGSVRALKQHCKGAAVGAALAIHGADAPHSRTRVEGWARENLA